MKLGNKEIGTGHPCYVIAEIGINHNGDLELAKRLIDASIEAGADAVKFQKRTLEICIPEHMRNQERETPWGVMSYMKYKECLEFGELEYDDIDDYCKQRGIDWFASVWDIPSVEFMERYNPIAYKIPSAMNTNMNLIQYVANLNTPLLISVGGCDISHINAILEFLPIEQEMALLHCTSVYPCPDELLNLSVIENLSWLSSNYVGYSGHEIGLATTVAAVALGADIVERHITLDRAMWGSDQAASIEPHGFKRMVRDIRAVESAMGDGVKRYLEEERKSMEALRWHVRNQ